ncbi:phosphate ABC transporter substrate-binding protein PstS [Bifidobacterium psychraerophilum]|jgi:phosphate transport system substrate-binding protein|uniref:Phosphate-binding protein n=1 Tax=Bifidobacterium psychraerophilum TaxID=218140 RepID=A0A087CNM1_9BIFI|nr:phosphate ABC transporter substrate-binding protein PstS [Bifidobacterium psychraerophilum]KFI84871.1 phosphate ABC transporter, substrate-binding protein PstS [Bifidobacterium psychraerophilum]MCI1805375.1 phosphate ABC transporter substrate-binding protein PstS [Bifidobacterium psychraerophilum]MCI2177365.1 phosphate ABC transporter substrate-binding protein PstS [Bifidobacterium psychraerophilum]MCI2182894.1 phosphate ABC transporter substrate-binding protein PstS [Bifidobacterium psychra
MRKNVLIRSVAAISGLVMMASLAACGDNTSSTAEGTSSSSAAVQISGEFAGAGASSQQSAVEAWQAGFEAKQPDAKISYDPSGSGAGVTTFLTGSTVWAGSDAALTSDQVTQSKSVCASGTAFDVPVYISPIAIVYNLKSAGLNGSSKHVNLDGETIAKIFDGKITKWNDDAIKTQNPDIDLPDLAITVVHRSDKSGTTKNFLSYVKDTAGSAWPYDVEETWPNQVGQGAKGTSGVISTVTQAEGTIGYADASQVGTLGSAAVKVGTKYVAYSADAAAKVVDASPKDDTATQANRVVIKLDHNTTEDGAYPVVLVSYDIACPAYKDTKNAEFAKQWLTYVVSEEGQKTAAETAGSAPMSASLRTEVMKSINAISTK